MPFGKTRQYQIPVVIMKLIKQVQMGGSIYFAVISGDSLISLVITGSYCYKFGNEIPVTI